MRELDPAELDSYRAGQQPGPVPAETLFKVDPVKGEVRCVTGGAWPARDSEGETCFENTHFSTQREALEKLRAESEARIKLIAGERGILLQRIADLQQAEMNARESLSRALDGLQTTRKEGQSGFGLRLVGHTISGDAR